VRLSTPRLHHNRGLDFTFVWVDGEPGLKFGSICLARNAFAASLADAEVAPGISG
jgi:hypothetical protein